MAEDSADKNTQDGRVDKSVGIMLYKYFMRSKCWETG